MNRATGIKLMVVGAVAVMAGGFTQTATAQERSAGAVQADSRAGPVDLAVYAPRGMGDLTICVAKGGLEVARVSYDDRGGPETWVRLDREKGEVISTERIDPDSGLVGTIRCLDDRDVPIG